MSEKQLPDVAEPSMNLAPIYVSHGEQRMLDQALKRSASRVISNDTFEAMVTAIREGQAATVALEAAREREAQLEAALRLLVNDVQDYEAWQRPCYALDVAKIALGLLAAPSAPVVSAGQREGEK